MVASDQAELDYRGCLPFDCGHARIVHAVRSLGVVWASLISDRQYEEQ